MKTSIDCLPCLLRQTLQTVKLCTTSDHVQEKAVRAVADFIATCDLGMSPPLLAAEVYEIIEEVTGVADPYAEKKKESNEIALSILPSLVKEVQECDYKDGLLLAIRFAIAGNIIDYGAYNDFDISGTLLKCRTTEFVIDHTEKLLQAIEGLGRGANVLYLADNCGEVVFDTLLVEKLFSKGFKITIAVKDRPIINDALISDAYAAGLDKYGEIISNGTGCPGTVLERVSKQFLDIYENADLVISKGQGNFEGLSEADRDIFFLLTVKCAAAAKHLREISSCEKTTLKGVGEMVVFQSSPRT
ncbi:damage-control phosphatase ARMT1 family protein [Desulforhopalus sp. 52FAK]